ncbi:MAG: DUF4136 domain-containing protein [Pseudomonadales bacterium]|nr:DUF4136 domain-containing protein [Pseudomonadales bacterium]
MKKLFLLSLVMVLSGCATDSLNEEVIAHPNYDISSFKTYTWAKPPVAVVGVLAGAESVQLELRMKDAVNRMLQARGYRLEEAKNAQLEVSTLVGAMEESSYSTHVVDSQRYYGAQFRWTQENDYLRGAVSVIFTHPDNKDIVWQGSVGENLKNDANRARGTVGKFIGIIGDMLPRSQ